MSQIPRFGGGKPVIRTTSTVTTKTPGGGSKTVTNTSIRELLPCSAGAGGQTASKASGCHPCPSKAKGKTGVPQMPSRIRPPGTHHHLQHQQQQQQQYQASSRCGALSSRRMPGPAPGHYNVPPPPPTITTHGMGGQMQAHLPKNKPCPCAKHKADEQMNQQTAEEMFHMSGPEVNMVEEQAAHELIEKSMLEPDEAVFAKSQYIQQIGERQMIKTPAGMEPLLQQTYSEKRVERDEVAERIVKNLAVADMDERTGHGTRITISEQHLDPDYGLSSEGKDVVTVKETVSVTKSYTSTAKDVIHEVTRSKLNIDPHELAQMVEEETQDVENTLRMVPPDLPLHEDRYGVKKRLQKLRLNTESMILLEESVVNPPPTADEAMVETPPEALANIMHTVESGVTPDCAPDQIFHTLFEEKSNELSVILSSIGPGPLQDVVIPQALTKDIHKESMTPDLTNLTNIYKNVTDAKDWPPVDIFASVMDDASKSPQKDLTAIPFRPLQDEEMPWADEDLEPLVNIVGAEPAVVLDPAYIPDLESSNGLVEELSHGIEYFVNADPVQYMSRVQLRGTQPPPWFPGYIYSLPEFPDVVKLARNPDEVFISAWKSCQPKLIPDDSMSILH